MKTSRNESDREGNRRRERRGAKTEKEEKSWILGTSVGPTGFPCVGPTGPRMP